MVTKDVHLHHSVRVGSMHHRLFDMGQQKVVRPLGYQRSAKATKAGAVDQRKEHDSERKKRREGHAHCYAHCSEAPAETAADHHLSV
jgi:hypothetical protein